MPLLPCFTNTGSHYTLFTPRGKNRRLPPNFEGFISNNWPRGVQDMSPAPTCLAPATRAQCVKARIQASSNFKALSRQTSIMSQEQTGRIPYYFYYQPTSRTRRELGHPHTAKGKKGLLNPFQIHARPFHIQPNFPNGRGERTMPRTLTPPQNTQVTIQKKWF